MMIEHWNPDGYLHMLTHRSANKDIIWMKEIRDWVGGDRYFVKRLYTKALIGIKYNASTQNDKQH